jgi:Tol biopolymer transport system component
VGLEGGPPALFRENAAVYSPDFSLFSYPVGGVTVIERVADGARWTLANGARSISFSPDGEMVAWTGEESGPPFDTARRIVWVARFDGSEARQVSTVFGGGLVGWFPDGQHLLVSGRLRPEEDAQTIWSFPINGETPTDLVRGRRIRGIQLSPEGGWLAYQVTFSTDATGNGLWVANLETGTSTLLHLFGAYRWREEGRLLVIPLEMGATSHQLLQVDAESGEIRALTDPAVTPFKVANGDWSVSPDGRHIAYVSAEDHSIWALTLP